MIVLRSIVVMGVVLVLTSCGCASDVRRSDLRSKQNVKTIDNAIEKVKGMRGVTFEWRNDRNRNFPKGTHIGVVAQEVERVAPDLVITDRDGFKSVDYARLSCVLIEAVKEQQDQIEALQKTVLQLKSQGHSK